jgi:hypothetical protein
MSKTLHLGIITNDGIVPPSPRILPHGMVTDGDSYLCWGDDSIYGSGAGMRDDTLHVVLNGYEGGRDGVDQQRERLQGHLLPNERLIDYAVVTDTEDWAEDQKVWTLDTTMIGGDHA